MVTHNGMLNSCCGYQRSRWHLALTATFKHCNYSTPYASFASGLLTSPPILISIIIIITVLDCLKINFSYITHSPTSFTSTFFFPFSPKEYFKRQFHSISLFKSTCALCTLIIPRVLCNPFLFSAKKER